MGIRFGFLKLRFVLALILLSGLVLAEVSPVHASARCYVNVNGTASGTGTSWGDAFTDLQSALGNAACTEIWVAAGTYYPTATTDPTDIRTKTFTLKNNVSIYGGFAGTESLLNQRNPAANVTNLSGDIGITGDPADNAYHVVVASGTDSTALLDGFTITAGFADGDAGSGYSSGGGIYIYSGSPRLAQVTFAGNSASIGGGGMYNELSGSVLTDVTFLSNSAAYGGGMYSIDAVGESLQNVIFTANTAVQQGGGMYNTDSVLSLAHATFSSNSAQYGGGISNTVSNPGLSSVTFSGNTASMWGGGMYNFLSSPGLANVDFSGNSAGQSGGGMYNEHSSPTLNNVTFTANSVIISGGGMYNNNNSNPVLTNVTFSANSAMWFGGGILNLFASPTLTNVTFSSNSSESGGGVYNQNSSPVLSGVTFNGNSAASEGGGMHNFDASNPSLANVTFSGNSASTGGGMFNDTSSPSLVNVTFSANSAALGAGIMGGGAIITNSVLYGDIGGEISGLAEVSYSIVQGGYPGTGNLDANPLLKPLGSYGGLTQTMALSPGSPAIDAGTNTGCPAKDQRGVARPQEGNGIAAAVCDMGATESRFLARTFQSTGKQDGWVLESTEVSEVGGTIDTAGDGFLLGDDAQDRQYRAILSFSTGGLPDNALITSASLRVRKAGLTGTDPFAANGNILVDVRKGAFSGNAGLQIGDFRAQAGKNGVMTILNNPVSGWYSRSMTLRNFTYINKTGITQFRLRFAKDDNDNLSADTLKFFSGNSAAAGYRPQLIVKYYLP